VTNVGGRSSFIVAVAVSVMPKLCRKKSLNGAVSFTLTGSPMVAVAAVFPG
jgi:hypothetical protein